MELLSLLQGIQSDKFLQGWQRKSAIKDETGISQSKNQPE